MGEIRSVIGVIDEIDDDDPRPIRVEDRRGMLGEEVVDDIFESVSIDSTEPIHDRFVVVRRLVSVFDDVVNRGGVGGSSFDGFPNHVGVEGEPSTPSIGNSERWSSAKVSMSAAEICLSGSVSWLSTPQRPRHILK